MSLDKIYIDRIKNTPNPCKVTSMVSGSHFPSIEKDPTIKKLTEDVFSQMAELDKRDNPNPEPNVPNPMELKTFTLEDAIKELHSMAKKDK